ncbi:Serine/threonine-protein kinase-transforming protein Rmil [Fasciola gigantica]|uniref:Serine/threonine-protein kinase-transforming protein Rmil n=1 Tax=Fasciola gigantica TaxID=46835 RepID=A0A504YS92_FASGI|nr:Serine/threonine-protein kinase-transforming protein Rmil [Fasciola gigantica]
MTDQISKSDAYINQNVLGAASSESQVATSKTSGNNDIINNYNSKSPNHDVHTFHPFPHAIISLPVSWEDDAVSVAHLGEELVVDFARRNLKRSEHQFQRKTFFEKAHCNLCHKFIFHG